MKEILKYALILMTVTLIASGALALVNSLTAPKIEAQKQKELQQGLSNVLCNVDYGIIEKQQLNGHVYYTGYADKDTSQLSGYAFSAYGLGYSSTIWILVGIDTAGFITGINILDQKETPGLGARCTEIKSGEKNPWWVEQFRNKNAKTISVVKDGGTIESITGATITSRAITNAISEKSKILLQQLNNQG
ncbi:RnfABCDGE type electron transport complex subunit G [bacterium]|nr:RnfABCDGE type electron transport complex subunit G [bacterium]